MKKNIKKNKNNLKYRKFKDFMFFLFIVLFSIAVLIPVVLILYYVFKNGLGVINLNFLTSLPKPVGENGSGIINGIAGTFMVVLIASFFSIPTGILAGVFLAENENHIISKILRLSVEILQGIPSIVIGIIGWIWIVLPMRHFSAFSGGIALGIMMLPILIKSTEETVKLVPMYVREASIALGVPVYKTIIKVVIPSSLGGIINGILMGITRITGETAPLLFTAFGNPFFTLNIFKPVDTLPLLIFNYGTSPYKDWHDLAWGISVILILIILFFNFISRLFVKKLTVKF